MRNKKGVIGTIMTTFVVGIIVIIMVVGYLALTGTMKITKPAGSFSPGERAEMQGILLKNINIYGEEKNVFDALLSAENYYLAEKGIKISDYEDSLKGNISALVLEEIGNNKEARCLILGRGAPAISIALRFENGKVSKFGGAEAGNYLSKAVTSFQFALSASADEFRYVEMKNPGSKEISPKIDEKKLGTIDSYYGPCLGEATG